MSFIRYRLFLLNPVAFLLIAWQFWNQNWQLESLQFYMKISIPQGLCSIPLVSSVLLLVASLKQSQDLVHSQIHPKNKDIMVNLNF